MKDELPLHRTVERHWREHRPKMVKQLEAKGLLDRAVRKAVDRTVEAESRAIRQGVQPWVAQEMYREVWALLPTEGDLPRLDPGRNPMIYASAEPMKSP